VILEKDKLLYYLYIHRELTIIHALHGYWILINTKLSLKILFSFFKIVDQDPSLVFHIVI